tara:strand:+ start:250 stop:411 length:162 start_codon:yes stop_codon:yes gene_type:complete
MVLIERSPLSRHKQSINIVVNKAKIYNIIGLANKQFITTSKYYEKVILERFNN